MKKIALFVILVISCIGLNAQGNLGIIGGGTYYNGELNPRKIMQSPSYFGGLLYRHNFNDRWSFRISVLYADLKGDDKKSDNSYQLQRGHSFNTEVWELGPQVEYNFLKYNKEDYSENYFTPYLTTGFLITIIPDIKKSFEFAVPFGLGIKYALTEKATIGLEWSYRWTNSDEIDGLVDDNFIQNKKTQNSYNPDTDWYSFVGAFITIQLFKQDDNACPAYVY